MPHTWPAFLAGAAAGAASSSRAPPPGQAAAASSTPASSSAPGEPVLLDISPQGTEEALAQMTMGLHALGKLGLAGETLAPH